MKNGMMSAAAKKISPRCHFIEEQTSKGRVSVKLYASKERLTDILTKTLPRQIFEEIRCQVQVAEREFQGKQHITVSIYVADQTLLSPTLHVIMITQGKW